MGWFLGCVNIDLNLSIELLMKLILQAPPPIKIAERKVFGRLLFALLVVLSAAVGASAGLLLVYSTDLPQVEELERYLQFCDRTLRWARTRHRTFALQRRVIAAYEDYPEVLRNALVSIEDKDFYRHSGINLWRIAGAAYRDIESGGKVQGASTFTMQLARNLFLSPIARFIAKCRKRSSRSRLSAGSPNPRFSPCMRTRFFLATGIMV